MRRCELRRALTAALLATVVVSVNGGPVEASAGQEAEEAYRAGKAAASEKEGRRKFQEGIDAARAALQKDPNDPAALLWYAANLGAEALTHSKLYALRVIDDLEKTLLKLEALHPNYDHAAAARALGRLYHQAPAVISVGSKKKADEYLGKALARAPDFPGNQAFAADLYAGDGDCARARPLAVKLAARRDLDSYGVDGKEWRAIAQRTLKECAPGNAR